MAEDRTAAYLALLGRQYKVVNYSYSYPTTNVKVIIAPFNPQRVSLYIQLPMGAGTNLFMGSPGGTFLLPVKSNDEFLYITTVHDLILPQQEIYMFGSFMFPLTYSAWGIVKT